MYEISLVATTLTYLVASSTLIRLKRACIFLCFRNVNSLFILQFQSSNDEKLVFGQLRIKVLNVNSWFQAGDSSTEATSGPPSVYANAGLYGNVPAKKEPVKRRRTHSGSLGLGIPTSEAIVTNNPAAVISTTVPTTAEHALLGKSNSLATSATTTAQSSKTHKRQTSFPASNQPQPSNR